MRCSSCRTAIKPVIAIDLDGTLGDYHSHFLRFAASYLYNDKAIWVASIAMYDGSTTFSQYCMNLFEIDLTTYREIKLAYRQGGMKRTMPPVGGCGTFVTDVKVRCDAEIWITTTRPYLSLDNIVKDSVAWLEHHHIQYHGILFDEDKYTTLAERVGKERVVAVLDDLYDMYDAVFGIYGPDVPILMRNKFNEFQDPPHVAENYHQAVDMIVDRTFAWQDRHNA